MLTCVGSVWREGRFTRSHLQSMSVGSIARMLSLMLYGRRFFPYYTFNIVAGVDEDGAGMVYGYDAIGSYDSVKVVAQGAGQRYIIPLLDNLVRGCVWMWMWMWMSMWMSMSMCCACVVWLLACGVSHRHRFVGRTRSWRLVREAVILILIVVVMLIDDVCFRLTGRTVWTRTTRLLFRMQLT